MGDDIPVSSGINSILFGGMSFFLLGGVARKISTSPVFVRRAALQTIFDLGNKSIRYKCKADPDTSPFSDYLVYTRYGVSITFTETAPDVIEIIFFKDLHDFNPDTDPSPRSPNGGARIAGVNFTPEPENPIREAPIFATISSQDDEEKSNDILVPIIIAGLGSSFSDEVLEDIVGFKGLRDSYMNWLSDRARRIPDVVEALAAPLSDSDWQVRYQASMGLSRSDVCAPGVIDALSKALDDEDHYVRFWAADALAERAPVEPNAMTTLLDAYREECLSVFWNEYARRHSVAFVLKSGLVPVIIADDASCDVVNEVRVVLCVSVGGAFSSVFATSLLEVYKEKEFIKSMEMSDKTALARFTIVPALARIAEVAPDALNVLRDGLENPSFAIRFSVAEYVKSKSGLADKWLLVFWNEYARRRSVAFALKSGLVPVIIADDASCDVVNKARFSDSSRGGTAGFATGYFCIGASRSRQHQFVLDTASVGSQIAWEFTRHAKCCYLTVTT